MFQGVCVFKEIFEFAVVIICFGQLKAIKHTK